MKEKTLESAISLFALVANFRQGKGYSLITNVIEIYLSSQFSRQTTELGIEYFRTRLQEYDQKRRDSGKEWKIFFDNELEAKCYILGREMTMAQRLLMTIYVMDFLPHFLGIDSKLINKDDETGLYDLLRKISNDLFISESDFQNSLYFISSRYEELSDDNSTIIVTGNEDIHISGVRVVYEPDLDSQIIFLWLRGIESILFQVSGDSQYEMNGRQVFKRRTYVFPAGSSLIADGIKTFYYNDIYRHLLKSSLPIHLKLEAEGVEYLYSHSDQGVHELHLVAESGDLLAIMGGSGSGKTTLMNLLAGLLAPQKGRISLNGIDVSANPEKVRKFIGYVPQDDALNADLSIYNNLLYTASLSMGKLSLKERHQRVMQILKDLDLWEIRELKVGSPLKKVISGGQRKRLNIALELVRNPGVLFLDEPTSGLSSSDSEKLMRLLKKYAEQGRIVIVNIHQPSSAIYKLFDKLLFLDKGGHAVYFGSSLRINSYLKKALMQVDWIQGECPTCGQMNPEEIFDMVQKKKIVSSDFSDEGRLISPSRWHRRYTRLYHATYQHTNNNESLVNNDLQLPGKLRQLYIYSLRNAQTKISDLIAFFMSLILPALLGIGLSFFTKHIPAESGIYAYSDNRNIPAFLFMSVIVSIFIGLISSSQEIIKDRGILKREAFLSLSYLSYVASKMIYLILLSGIQMFLYVQLSFWVLEIPSQSEMFFLLMWASTVASAAFGLLLSSLFKSLSSVYLAIPLVIIPQIMLAGAVIQFDQLHPIMTHDDRSPWISQVMLSRWVYEGLSVELFHNNEYSRSFYKIDQAKHDAVYVQNFLIPEIEEQFFGDHHSSDVRIGGDTARFHLIESGLNMLVGYGYSAGFHQPGEEIEGSEMLTYLDSCRNEVSKRNERYSQQKDSMIETLGVEKYQLLLQQNRNKRLVDFLTRQDESMKVKISHGMFIRKYHPIYDIPQNEHWHEQFFSPYHRFWGELIYTPLYNLVTIIVIMLMALGLVLLNRIKY